MNPNETYLQQAREVLKIEAEAVAGQAERLGEEFTKAVELILACSGRVVVTGMGKSGLIGRKIAATLASTGTPAFFLHPGDAIHGDLGMVTQADVLLAISYTGETDELLAILPSLKVIGAPIISITDSRDSTLAKQSEIVINVRVEREACTMGLAPTTSTTATMAVGDALAVVLSKARNFKEEDYALFHPGGSLGRRLLTVEKVMYGGTMLPLIAQEKTLQNAIVIMTGHGNHGAAFMVDGKGILTGIVTDGDLRRILEKYANPLTLPLSEVMTKNPKTITPEKLAGEALHIMETKNITVLPVVDETNRPVGIVHLHDIIKGMTGLKPRI